MVAVKWNIQNDVAEMKKVDSLWDELVVGCCKWQLTREEFIFGRVTLTWIALYFFRRLLLSSIWIWRKSAAIKSLPIQSDFDKSGSAELDVFSFYDASDASEGKWTYTYLYVWDYANIIIEYMEYVLCLRAVFFRMSMILLLLATIFDLCRLMSTSPPLTLDSLSLSF